MSYTNIIIRILVSGTQTMIPIHRIEAEKIYVYLLRILNDKISHKIDIESDVIFDDITDRIKYLKIRYIRQKKICGNMLMLFYCLLCDSFFFLLSHLNLIEFIKLLILFVHKLFFKTIISCF